MFTLPTATATITAATEWSSELFTAMLPLIYVLVGVVVFGVVFRYLSKKLGGGIARIGGGRRGRRRR